MIQLNFVLWGAVYLGSGFPEWPQGWEGLDAAVQTEVKWVGEVPGSPAHDDHEGVAGLASIATWPLIVPWALASHLTQAPVGVCVTTRTVDSRGTGASEARGLGLEHSLQKFLNVQGHASSLCLLLWGNRTASVTCDSKGLTMSIWWSTLLGLDFAGRLGKKIWGPLGRAPLVCWHVGRPLPFPTLLTSHLILPQMSQRSSDDHVLLQESRNHFVFQFLPLS